MAMSSSDMAGANCTDAQMKEAAAKGSSGGSSSPRQDPRQPAGMMQASNPHLQQQHGFVDHKKGGGKK